MRVPRRPVLLLLYLGVLALFLEASSRLVFRSEALSARILGNDESSFRLAWIHRGSLPGVAYSFDEYHPTRGWTLLPSIRGALVFGDRTLNTNAQGLRGSTDTPYDRTPGVPRVEVLGDSFTFGEEVSDEEAYPARLARDLPGTEVLNLGQHGYGHDQMLLYLEEEGLRYHPDIVVLGFHPFDMERNILSFRDFAKPRFTLDGGRLVLRNTPVPTPEQVRAEEPYRSKFWDLVTMLGDRTAWISGRKDREMKAVTRAILTRFAGLAEERGFRFVVAYLPVWHELDPGPRTDGEEFFLSFCASARAECFDLRPSFLEREAQGERFKTAGHWNRREHEAAAGFLAPRLRALLVPGGE
jgi:hypothetical protein